MRFEVAIAFFAAAAAAAPTSGEHVSFNLLLGVASK